MGSSHEVRMVPNLDESFYLHYYRSQVILSSLLASLSIPTQTHKHTHPSNWSHMLLNIFLKYLFICLLSRRKSFSCLIRTIVITFMKSTFWQQSSTLQSIFTLLCYQSHLQIYKPWLCYSFVNAPVLHWNPQDYVQCFSTDYKAILFQSIGLNFSRLTLRSNYEL